MNRILVVRPDRLGDVVLSTPVLEALKRSWPCAMIHVLVRDAVAPIVESNPNISGLLVYRPSSEHRGIAGVRRLAREIRAMEFDAALVLQDTFQVSLAVYFAGVPVRVGPLSKWHSRVVFNRGIRQKRSAVAMHEAEYNLALLSALGLEPPRESFRAAVCVDPERLERMRELVKQRGIAPGRPFVIVHPGMGGSALNWPKEHYASLVKGLSDRGVAVVVTGSTTEQRLVESIMPGDRNLGDRSSGSGLVNRLQTTEYRDPEGLIRSFLGEISPRGLADLVALISLCRVMVAPSTGPLHLAAALGKRTVSFYPPIKVQSARRWGPYDPGPDPGRHAVLVPQVDCGEDFKCAGARCPHFFCMERISVEKAIAAVMEAM